MNAPTPEQLQAEVDAGRVRRRRHPSLPLSLYTYTEHCTYSGEWNPVNTLCRGLVVEDDTGRVVAWPFPKFHNHHDHANGKPWAPPLPDLPFDVMDKVDGSLAIIFRYADRWHAATKGSFESDQARWAQEWLDAHEAEDILPHGFTYLAEILYPENRIVVDYDLSTLVLLGVYTDAGVEIPCDLVKDPWRIMGGRLVRSWACESLDHLVQCAAANRDFRHGAPLSGTDTKGYVVRFADGTRVKVKIADYVRLHAIITRTSERTVWEALKSGTDMSDLLAVVPDEFADWIRETAQELLDRHKAWTFGAEDVFYPLFHLRDNRKEFALAVKDSPYRAALFRLLDGKDIVELAWKAVRPENTMPRFHDPEDDNPVSPSP